MSVSIDGSTSRNQVCGLKIAAALSVAAAVEADAFKRAMKAAAEQDAGDGTTVEVEITTFVQTVSSSASCPGTADMYESDAAQQQFRTGVKEAAGGGDLITVVNLCIDGQSCSAGVCEACSAGRRLLNSRRRLQTVDITYDIVVDGDPEVAAEVAADVVTATANPATFATELATAINEAGDGNGLPVLALDEIVVSEATIETDIDYEIVVQTTDITVVNDVRAELDDPSQLAVALESAIAVESGGPGLADLFDASSLRAVVTCSRPDISGYSYTETNLDPDEFDVTVTCASGYETSGSGPTAEACAASGEAFALNTDNGQCVPIVCESITGADAEGYTFDESNLDLSAGDFNVAVSCASGYETSGSGSGPTAEACTTSGEAFTLNTDNGQCIPIVCESPTGADAEGYTFDETNLDLSAGDFNVAVSCASGYETSGSGPTAEACTTSGAYTASGCSEERVSLPPPPPPPSEEEGGSAGLVIGIILGIVAVAVVGFFGVKAMKGKGSTETTGARPSMLSPSAAAYQTDDVDPEDGTTRPGRKLSF